MRAARASAIGAATTVVCVLPVYLTGTMVTQIREEFTFGAAGLGVAAAIFWAVNAMSSVPLGGMADRLGPRWSIRVAATIALTSGLGIALLSTQWWHLVAWLSLAGAAHAIGHPAANGLLVDAVPMGRLGLAFGIKGAAPPVASMLAGIGVPIVAVTLGWRAGFLIAALFACLVLLATRGDWLGRVPATGAGQSPPRPTAADQSLRNGPSVLAVAISFGLGTATSASVTVFYVEAATRAGTSPALAGSILAVASTASVLVRVLSGHFADRLGDNQLRNCALMLGCGSFGVVLLATGNPVAMAVGVVVAMVGTWGFQALFWYALVLKYQDTPGRITGAVQPGAAVGGSVGPLLFGVAAGATLPGAWLGAAALGLVAAMLLAASAPGLGRAIAEA
ncbi:MFS transporter [Euzebya pacifica]|uniref:MFS transporter n=1 Tax=Euzebya pacifica TaxID=1608957 RepID=UPI0030FBC60F